MIIRVVGWLTVSAVCSLTSAQNTIGGGEIGASTQMPLLTGYDFNDPGNKQAVCSVRRNPPEINETEQSQTPVASTTSIGYRLVSTTEDLYQSLNINAAVSARFRLFSGGGSYSLEQRLGLTSLDMVFVSNGTSLTDTTTVDAQTDRQRVANLFGTSDPSKLVQFANDPKRSDLYRQLYDQWVEDCGRGFVSGVRRATGITMLTVFRFASTDVFNRVRAQIKAKYGSFVNASFSIDELLSTFGSTFSVDVQYFSFGGSDLSSLPDLPRPPVLFNTSTVTDPAARQEATLSNQTKLQNFFAEVFGFFNSARKNLNIGSPVSYDIQEYDLVHRPKGTSVNVLRNNDNKLILLANQYATLMDIYKQLNTVDIDPSSYANESERAAALLYTIEYDKLLSLLNKATNDTYEKALRCVEDIERSCNGPTERFWYRQLELIAKPTFEVPPTATTPDDPAWRSNEYFPRYKLDIDLLQRTLDTRVASTRALQNASLVEQRIRLVRVR